MYLQNKHSAVITKFSSLSPLSRKECNRLMLVLAHVAMNSVDYKTIKIAAFAAYRDRHVY